MAARDSLSACARDEKMPCLKARSRRGDGADRVVSTREEVLLSGELLKNDSVPGP